jgi:hypothetical protein
MAMNVVLLLLVMLEAVAQSPTIVAPRNLLTNTDAENGLNSWQSAGDATVEQFNGNSCFVVRNGGRLT